MHSKNQIIENTFEPPSSLSHVEFEPNDYLEDLEVTSLNPDEIEMLQALWNIMSHMVYLGWEVDSVSMIFNEFYQAANDNNEKED